LIILKNLQKIKSPNEEFVEKVMALKMPIYWCSCGSEILVVPDLAAMDRAVQKHIGHHNRITGDRLTGEALTMTILRAISKMPLRFN
jgi:hypothetical protein